MHGWSVLTYDTSLYSGSPCNDAYISCRVSAEARVVGRRSIVQRVVKHDNMFTVCACMRGLRIVEDMLQKVL